MVSVGPRTRSYASAYSQTGPLVLRACDDVVTANYRQRVDDGELINNPFTSVQYNCTGPSSLNYNAVVFFVPWAPRYLSTISTRNDRYLVDSWASFDRGALASILTSPSLGGGMPIFTTNDVNLLTTAVSADIGSGLAQIYVTLAESKQTVNMFARAVSLLRRPLGDAKDILRLTRSEIRTPEGRNRLLSKAGELWLEGRYGWRPFVFDVMSTFDALANGKTVRYTARRKLSETKTAVIQSGLVYNSGCDPIGVEHTVHVQRKLRVGSTVDYALDVGAGSAAAFGVADLLGSAWELVRYSFVVDWFLNVGDSLQALQAYALAAERIAWVTTETTVNVESKSIIPGPSSDGWSWYQSFSGQDSWREEAKVRVRTPVTDFLPSLGYRFKIDVAKAIDALFLLKKALGISTRL